jgi:hypothetical protein
MIPACRDSSSLYSEAVKADKEIDCSCVCKNHGVTMGLLISKLNSQIIKIY